jgi:long-chain acyl-CoA synthetase
VGTIGPPLPGVDIKISPKGEILMRGPILMKGYYKNPEATAEVLDSEGWLHTGDKGVIDDEGFVKLIGRLKEMYKTSTGEYVVPVPIEQELAKAPLIDWAMVIADKRKYASALLFPNQELLEAMKKKSNQSLSDEEFLESPEIKEQMQKLLAKINGELNHWEQIRNYRFVPYTLSIEKSELTPSLKLRREIISEKFSDQIESMYHGG